MLFDKFPSRREKKEKDRHKGSWMKEKSRDTCSCALREKRKKLNANFSHKKVG